MESCLQFDVAKVLEEHAQRKFARKNLDTNIFAERSGKTGMDQSYKPLRALGKVIYNAKVLQNHENAYIRYWGNIFTETKAGSENVKQVVVDSIPAIQQRIHQHFNLRLKTAYQMGLSEYKAVMGKPKRFWQFRDHDYNNKIADQLFHPKKDVPNYIKVYTDELEKLNNEMLDLLEQHNVISSEYKEALLEKLANDKSSGHSHIYFPRVWDREVNRSFLQNNKMVIRYEPVYERTASGNFKTRKIKGTEEREKVLAEYDPNIHQPYNDPIHKDRDLFTLVKNSITNKQGDLADSYKEIIKANNVKYKKLVDRDTSEVERLNLQIKAMEQGKIYPSRAREITNEKRANTREINKITQDVSNISDEIAKNKTRIKDLYTIIENLKGQVDEGIDKSLIVKEETELKELQKKNNELSSEQNKLILRKKSLINIREKLDTEGKELPKKLEKLNRWRESVGVKNKFIDYNKKKQVAEKDIDKKAKKLADEIIEAYSQRLANPNYEFLNKYGSPMLDQQGFLEDMFKVMKEKMPEDELLIDDFLEAIYTNTSGNKLVDNLKKERHATAKVMNFKNRIDLDYNTQLGNVKMSNFYSQDTFALNDYYFQNMAGRIALGKYGIDTIKQGSGFEKIIDEINREAVSKNQNYTDEAKTLQNVYDIITGKTIMEELSKGQQTTSRVLSGFRTWGQTVMLGQTGLTVGAEVAFVASENGFKRFFKHLNRQGGFGSRLSTGKLHPQDMNSIEQLVYYTGLGNELDDPQFTRYFDAQAETIYDKGGKLENARQSFGYYIHRVSGLTYMVQFSRRMAMITFLDRLNAEGSAGLKPIFKSQLGLKDPQIDAIQKAIQGDIDKFGKDSKGRIQKLAMQDWDPEVRDNFVKALVMQTHTIISNPSPAAMNKWFYTPAGRTLGSILTFFFGTFNLLHRQTRLLAHGDKGAIAGLFAMGAASYLIYLGKSWLAAQGRSDGDKYMEDRLKLGSQILGTGSYISPTTPLFWVMERYTRPDAVMSGLTPPIMGAFGRSAGSLLYALKDIGSFEWPAESAFRNIFRAIPFSNVYGINILTNKLAEILGD